MYLSWYTENFGEVTRNRTKSLLSKIGEISSHSVLHSALLYSPSTCHPHYFSPCTQDTFHASAITLWPHNLIRLVRNSFYLTIHCSRTGSLWSLTLVSKFAGIAPLLTRSSLNSLVLRGGFEPDRLTIISRLLWPT